MFTGDLISCIYRFQEDKIYNAFNRIMRLIVSLLLELNSRIFTKQNTSEYFPSHLPVVLLRTISTIYQGKDLLPTWQLSGLALPNEKRVTADTKSFVCALIKLCLAPFILALLIGGNRRPIMNETLASMSSILRRI
uniref:Uncharacterized protein n=1 Tax=Glossina pallidipes TaxID=7398 RepID=A0A1A9ZGZ3_GLOPL